MSLREEAEEAQIREPIQLVYENMRFFCALPLRGKFEDFLTTNKRDAAKILERQVRLYHKEKDTRNLILKAMEKLIRNGHVSLLKDLPQEEQQEILDQPVQYFIHWCTVFSLDLKEASDTNLSGVPLCVIFDSLNIFNAV